MAFNISKLLYKFFSQLARASTANSYQGTCLGCLNEAEPTTHWAKPFFLNQRSAVNTLIFSKRCNERRSDTLGIQSSEVLFHRSSAPGPAGGAYNAAKIPWSAGGHPLPIFQTSTPSASRPSASSV